MELAMVGLGRMGGNMARRLLRGGHRVVVWNRTFAKAQELEIDGRRGRRAARGRGRQARGAAGDLVHAALRRAHRRGHRRARAAPASGDIVIDGGNSPYQHDVERGARLEARGCATSTPARAAACGGSRSATASWSAATAAPSSRSSPRSPRWRRRGHGYEYCGGHGAGHFVKMVHNGIEYGMMQAYGEGFELLKESGYDLDLAVDRRPLEPGQRGALLAARAGRRRLRQGPRPRARSPATSTTPARAAGRCSRRSSAACPCRSSPLSLFARFRSRQPDSFSGKVLAALRNEFGGHAVKAK